MRMDRDTDRAIYGILVIDYWVLLVEIYQVGCERLDHMRCCFYALLLAIWVMNSNVRIREAS
jgi:hypothetical protein